MSADGLDGYATDLQQSILLEADVEGSELMRSEVLTRHMIDILIEAGELEDAIACYHRDRGIEVHGYGIDDGDTLNLIGTIHRGEVPPPSVAPTDVNTAARRLLGLWERCRDQSYHERLEESSDAYDMALHIHHAASSIRRLRLFVVTDGRTTVPRLSTHDADGLEVRRSVWDIERLHRLETSGQPREPIEIDLVDRFGGALPCLPTEAGGEYRAMLAVFPGAWLADIYHQYGARLLELNVRSFLQATGKVNRGIRDTLREEPERFLAYNNGISATASGVDVVPLSDGGYGISRIRDLQIVNGGQTTASIHRASVTGVPLGAVSVQTKLTVVPPEQLDEIVPLISRYANSQNKVSEADLRSNDPFHVELESLSRTVWTPATGEALRQTHWFYERARGQYRDALSREGTPARQRAWKVANPTTQRFTKTDVAKYENTWAQLPHEVSRGAQKNFTVFMAQLARSPIEPSVGYYERLVAKGILWRRAERLVTEQAFGGYRANLVAYALAKLSHASSQRIDLGRIWREQALDRAVEDAITDLSKLAWGVLVDDAPAGANVTEWAKREACWQRMREVPWAISAGLSADLLVLGRPDTEAATDTLMVEDPASLLIARGPRTGRGAGSVEPPAGSVHVPAGSTDPVRRLEPAADARRALQARPGRDRHPAAGGCRVPDQRLQDDRRPARSASPPAARIARRRRLPRTGCLPAAADHGRRGARPVPVDWGRARTGPAGYRR